MVHKYNNSPPSCNCLIMKDSKTVWKVFLSRCKAINFYLVQYWPCMGYTRQCFVQLAWSILDVLSEQYHFFFLGFKLCLEDSLVFGVALACNWLWLLSLTSMFLEESGSKSRSYVPFCCADKIPILWFFSDVKKRILIPIVYTPCKIPSMLGFITRLDYTSERERRYFWNRLTLSLGYSNSRTCNGKTWLVIWLNLLRVQRQGVLFTTNQD